MSNKLVLTLTREDGAVVDKWTSDDLNDRTVFSRLRDTKEVSRLTQDRIQDSFQSTFWVKDIRTYLIKAQSEGHALAIFNHKNFDDDWVNQDVESGFEI